MNMKKLVALLLALVMVFALCACGPKDNQDTGKKDDGKKTAMKADDIPDEMTSSDGKYQVAFVTDVGDLKDKSFNQGTYDGVKLYANANSKSYKYYKPANGDKATDDDRYDAMKAAVDNGAEVVVAAGFLQGAALEKAAKEFTDTKFVFIDGSPVDGVTNLAAISFREEQCGYLAGYAAVMEGYTKLGFLGGMAVPAVVRYGFGYVQGVDAAAKELGITVDLKYAYGNQFVGDADITAAMDTWYQGGTEIVFACGGGIYTSAVEAALKNNGYVIGVDVDQNYIGANGVADGTYAYNPFITSAMKGLSESVSTALGDIEAGEWSSIAATNGNFGLEDGDYVGLPTADDSWNFKTFTKDEYEALKSKIASGEIVVDNSSDDATKPTVSEFTKVNYIQ